jgi:hypothetical protein
VNVTKTSTGVVIHLDSYRARTLARVLQSVLGQRGPSFIFDDHETERDFIAALRAAIVDAEVRITTTR